MQETIIRRHPPIVAANDTESRLERDAAELGRRAKIKRRRNETLHAYALRLQGDCYWLSFDSHWLLKEVEKFTDASPKHRPVYPST